MKRLKNKTLGARVIVNKVIVEISPKVKFRSLKNVYGTIVERGLHEQYWHTSDGNYQNVSKHIIKNDCHKNYAIRLDDNIVDIENNNIIVVREFDLKFIDYLPETVKIISKREYNKALKLIEEYEYQQTLV